MELFKLYGSVFVETSEAQRMLENVTNKAKKMGANLGDAIKSAAGVALSVAAVAAAAGAAMFKIADTAATNLDRVDKQARNMGVSNEWYQQWDYIAKICGTDMDTIQTAVETMSKRVGDGSKSAVEALGALNLTMIDAKDMAPEDLFEEIVTRLGDVEDSSQKASIANALLGPSWKELGTVTSSTADQIETMKQRCKDLGGVMSDEDIEKSAAFKDALTDWDTAVTGLKNQIGVTLIPVVQPFIETLTKFVVFLSNNVPAAFNAISTAIDGVVASATALTGGAAQKLAAGVNGDGTAAASAAPQISFRPAPSVVTMPGYPFMPTIPGRASGLDYAPFNGFPARLHRGERVLSAQEAQQWRQGNGSGGIQLTQNFSEAPKTMVQQESSLEKMLEMARWME